MGDDELDVTVSRCASRETNTNTSFDFSKRKVSVEVVQTPQFSLIERKQLSQPLRCWEDPRKVNGVGQSRDPSCGRRGRSQVKKQLKTTSNESDLLLENKYVLDFSVDEDISLLHRAVELKNNQSSLVLSMMRRSLGQLEVFRQFEEAVSVEKLNKLMGAFSFKSIQKGGTVYLVGEESEEYFIIVRGSVYVLQRTASNNVSTNNCCEDNTSNSLTNEKKTQTKMTKLNVRGKSSSIGEVKPEKLSKRIRAVESQRKKIIRSGESMKSDEKKQLPRENNSETIPVEPVARSSQIISHNSNDKLSTSLSVDLSNHMQGRSSSDWLDFTVETSDMLVRRESLKRRFPNFAVIGEHRAGEGFGENSLLRGTKRGSTVVAKENCFLLTVNRVDFMRFLGEVYERKSVEKIAFIRGFFFFATIQNRLQSFLHLFEDKVFISGQKIYKMGDQVDYLFLLKKGQVSISASRRPEETLHSSTNFDDDKIQVQTTQKEKNQSTGDNNFVDNQLLSYINDSANLRATYKRGDTLKSVAVLFDQSFFGEDEIVANEQVRKHEVVALSTQVEVICISRRNLAFITRSNDILEKLYQSQDVKQQWRAKYTTRCKESLINHCDQSKEKQQEQFYNNFLIMVDSSLKIPREPTDSLLNKKPSIKQRKPFQLSNMQQQQVEVVIPRHLLLSLSGEEKKPFKKEVQYSCVTDISCDDECQQRGNQSFCIASNQAKRKMEYATLNIAARQADSDARLVESFQGGTSSLVQSSTRINTATIKPCKTEKNEDFQALCFISQPSQAEIKFLRKKNEDKTQLAISSRGMVSGERANTTMKLQTTNWSTQQNQHPQICGRTERSQSVETSVHLTSQSKSFDYRSIHQIFIEINDMKQKRNDKFRKQFREVESQHKGASKKKFVIPSYDLLCPDPYVTRLAASKSHSIDSGRMSKIQVIAASSDRQKLQESEEMHIQYMQTHVTQEEKFLSEAPRKNPVRYISNTTEVDIDAFSEGQHSETEDDLIEPKNTSCKNIHIKQQYPVSAYIKGDLLTHRGLSLSKPTAAEAAATAFHCDKNRLLSTQPTNSLEVSGVTFSADLSEKSYSPLKNRSYIRPISGNTQAIRLVQRRKNIFYHKEEKYLGKEQIQQREKKETNTQEKSQDLRGLCLIMKKLKLNDQIFDDFSSKIRCLSSCTPLSEQKVMKVRNKNTAVSSVESTTSRNSRGNIISFGMSSTVNSNTRRRSCTGTADSLLSKSSHFSTPTTIAYRQQLND